MKMNYEELLNLFILNLKSMIKKKQYIPKEANLLIQKKIGEKQFIFAPVVTDSENIKEHIKEIIEESSSEINFLYIVNISKVKGLVRLTIEEPYMGFIYRKVITETEEIEFIENITPIFQ